jgi:hypothetical protein
MPTATNTFINFRDFVFTPTGGSPITIARITNAAVSRNGNPVMFKGDGSVYAEVCAVPDQDRSIEVDFGDVAKAASVPIGVAGTMTLKLADALNGVTPGGGGIQYTLGPCVAAANPSSGAHAQYATTKLTFVGFATDGATDPLTITPL